MTEGNTDVMRFARQGRRRVEADFNGGRLVSDAGLLLLRETDRQSGLSEALASGLSEGRQPGKIVHEPSTMLTPRVHAIAAGYEDLNDHQTLRSAFPDVPIIFRGDSGFCRWRLMRWCDRHEVGYIIGLARNQRLEAISAPFMQRVEADFQQSGETQGRFHEIDYAAEAWDRSRQVIVKAERLEQGPNLRFIVTNLTANAGDARTLYDALYCARGEMENRIKEQQLGLFADRTSCSKMIANQFRLLLAVAAYTLMQHLRRQTLHGTKLAHAQVTTIRTKLIQIAARVKVSARRVVLHLSSTCPLQPLFRRLAQRLHRMHFDTR